MKKRLLKWWKWLGFTKDDLFGGLIALGAVVMVVGAVDSVYGGDGWLYKAGFLMFFGGPALFLIESKSGLPMTKRGQQWSHFAAVVGLSLTAISMSSTLTWGFSPQIVWDFTLAVAGFGLSFLAFASFESA